MTKIFALLLPFSIKMILRYLKSRDDLKELDKEFISFVDKLENKPNTIAKISVTYEDQLKAARKKAKEGNS